VHTGLRDSSSFWYSSSKYKNYIFRLLTHKKYEAEKIQQQKNKLSLYRFIYQLHNNKNILFNNNWDVDKY
jgi:hypothetical protein